MKQTLSKIKGTKLLLSLIFAFTFILLSGYGTLHAEGELRLSLSQESVLLEPGSAITININYYSDLPVKNVNVILNSTQAPGFSVQNVLSSSGLSVNGTGSLGSITIIAPETYANGSVVLSATAEDANDPAIKFTTQSSIPVTVNIPPPGEVDPNASVEGETVEGGENTVGEGQVAPENFVLPTQAGVNLALKLNGVGEPVNVNISENAPGGLPEGYAEVVAEVQGNNIRTYKKAGRMPLIYVSLVEGGAESLYSLDVEKGNAYRFYPDVYTEIAGKSVIITSLTEPSPDPALVSESIEINAFTSTAWIGELKGEEYTVIRAEVDGKTSDLYRYAIGSDGGATLTPFLYAHVINPPSPTPVPTTTETSATAEAEEKGAGSSIDWFFWGLLLTLLVLLAGLVIIFMRNRRKHEQRDYRLAAEHYDAPVQRKIQKKGIQLRELRPNDFDDVDRYFAERREQPQRRNIDPAARSGVRKPRIHAHESAAPQTRPRTEGVKRYESSSRSVQRREQSSASKQRNPYRTYYKPQTPDYYNMPNSSNMGSRYDFDYGSQMHQRKDASAYPLINRQKPNSQAPLTIKRVYSEPDSLKRHDEVLFDAEEHDDGTPYGRF